MIISNCVINLSGDKDRVLREAFRVLKPGGRFAVSDVVTRGEVPEEVRKNMLLWVGCIAGERLRMMSTSPSWPLGFLTLSKSSPRAFTISRMRGPSLPGRASTWTLSRRKSKTSL